MLCAHDALYKMFINTFQLVGISMDKNQEVSCGPLMLFP